MSQSPSVYRRNGETIRVFWDIAADFGHWWDQCGSVATLRPISGMEFFCEGWTR